MAGSSDISKISAKLWDKILSDFSSPLMKKACISDRTKIIVDICSKELIMTSLQLLDQVISTLPEPKSLSDIFESNDIWSLLFRKLGPKCENNVYNIAYDQMSIFSHAVKTETVIYRDIIGLTNKYQVEKILKYVHIFEPEAKLDMTSTHFIKQKFNLSKNL